MRYRFIFGLLGITLFASSCGVYKQHILFQDDGTLNVASLEVEKIEAEALYALQPYDQFTLEVFTGNGERLIDPEFELMRDMQPGNQIQNRPRVVYTIQPDSTVRLPMVGDIPVGGLTQQAAEIVIQTAFLEYYEDTYAVISLQSRRVIVLGATGGQVIPLAYEGMTVIEVIAAAGGLTNTDRGQNIRLIRPPFAEPQVEIIDLTTLAGMQRAQLHVQPGDVIYIEPRPQVLQNGLRDVAPVLNLISSSFTILVVVLNLVNNG